MWISISSRKSKNVQLCFLNVADIIMLIYMLWVKINNNRKNVIFTCAKGGPRQPVWAHGYIRNVISGIAQNLTVKWIRLLDLHKTVYEFVVICEDVEDKRYRIREPIWLRTKRNALDVTRMNTENDGCSSTNSRDKDGGEITILGCCSGGKRPDSCGRTTCIYCAYRSGAVRYSWVHIGIFQVGGGGDSTNSAIRSRHRDTAATHANELPFLYDVYNHYNAFFIPVSL